MILKNLMPTDFIKVFKKSLTKSNSLKKKKKNSK